MSIKSNIKKWIPPIVFDFRGRLNIDNLLYYFGSFETWEDALKESNRLSGDYEDAEILERVEAATQKVRKGEALYEQDGVCFYEENNNWELMAALLYAETKISPISVLDMGGALGSTFFRYRNLIEDIEAKWCVVEQRHFVDRGRQSVPEINFYYSIDEAIGSENKPNILLLSSVLMYLDDPYQMFQDMLGKGFDYVIIDETAFFTDENANRKIMLQHVPASIYEAIYPAHILGLNEFRKIIDKYGYEIVWEWVYRGGQIPIKTKRGFVDTIDKGFLVKKK